MRPLSLKHRYMAKDPANDDDDDDDTHDNQLKRTFFKRPRLFLSDSNNDDDESTPMSDMTRPIPKKQRQSLPSSDRKKRGGGSNDDAAITNLVGSHTLQLDEEGDDASNEVTEEEEKLTRPHVLPIPGWKSKTLKGGSRLESVARRMRVVSDIGPATPAFDVASLAKSVAAEGPEEAGAAMDATPWSSSSSWCRIGRDHADDNWHEIAERKFTPEEERDLRIIENRQHLDPKRFYKSTGTGRKQGELPTRAHFGSVVVGAHDFYAARMNKRDRRARLIDEIMADRDAVSYIKQKGRDYQIQKSISKRIVDPASKRNRRRKGF